MNPLYITKLIKIANGIVKITTSSKEKTNTDFEMNFIIMQKDSPHPQVRDAFGLLN